MGFALGSWNLIAFWLNPLDDSVAGMLIVYGPMFISWSVAGFLVTLRNGRLTDAITAGTVFAFATVAIFGLANIVSKPHRWPSTSIWRPAVKKSRRLRKST